MNRFFHYHSFHLFQAWFAIQIPSIELPKGGGAIRGIDEKLVVNAVNGTASFSIPLPFYTNLDLDTEFSLSIGNGDLVKLNALMMVVKYSF